MHQVRHGGEHHRFLANVSCRYTQLDAMARAVFRPPVEPVPEFDPEDFDLPDTIQQWLEKEFDQEVG